MGLDILDSGQVVYIELQTKRVVGETVILECGSTLPDVYIWGYTIPGTEHIRAVVFNFGQGPKLQSLAKTLGDLNVITNTASLLIEKLPLGAQGLYTCQALYDTPQGAKLIYYYVQLLVLVPVSKPYLLVDDSSPVEGTPIWMRCSLENGSTPINYKWEHKSSDAEATTTTKVAEGNINRVNITSVNRNHTGWYWCLATNEVNQQRSDGIWLEVLFGPDVPRIDVTPYSVTERGYSAVERATVSLMCQASSNPPSQYVWFYNNSQVHTGQQYNITKILRMHSGHYSCLAQNYYLNTNSKTTITLYVYYPPNGSPTCTILPSNNYTDVVLWCFWEGVLPPGEPQCYANATLNNEYMMLSCSWEGGFPQALLWWTFNNGSLLGTLVNTSILVLRLSSRYSEKVFVCHAQHPLSLANKMCILKLVLPPADPQCYANATLNNEYLMLSCSWGGGFPQALHWWASNNGSLLGSPKENANILVLKSSSTYSGKVFVCHTKHPLSPVSKLCILTLDRPNGSPTCTIFPTNNYTDVALWCSWEGGYPPASLYWTSTLFSPNETEPSFTNTTLVQPGYRIPHNSTFTCHGSHVASPASYSCNTTALLPRGDPQCYANAPLNNEYFTLSCSWEGGSPQALLQWTFDNGSSQGSSKENTNTLVLKASSTYTLPPGEPQCRVYSTNLTLSCSWEGGSPQALLWWTFNDTSYLGSLKENNNVLLLEASFTYSGKVFVCHAKHPLSPTSKVCVLRLDPPNGSPTCTIRPTNNYTDVALWCSWEGDDGVTQGNFKESMNILILRSSVTFSGKAFVCHAKHPLALATKLCPLRLEAPVLATQLKVVSVYEGNDVQLSCILKANYPDTEITWFNNHKKQVGDTPSKYLLYREATWSNLTVREADGVQDSGQYWCSASNAVGGAEIPITVLIKRYPVPPNVTISKIKYSSQQRTEVDLQWAVKETGNLT
ncbi:carcinoembryonic antigen-related cell adhesion molecule 5-like, partial [Scleropages formosus]